MKFYKLCLPIIAAMIMSCNPEGSDKTDQFQKPALLLDDTRLNVGFLIMDGVYNTEFTAPYDIFQHTIFRDTIRAMNVFSVANTTDPIRTFEGLYILPDYDYTSKYPLPRIDILVVPSAEHHVDSDLDDDLLIDFVYDVGMDADFVISLCDGAFVLAESGLLNNRKSTTFPADQDIYEERYPNTEVVRDVSFVHDGKFITSVGGARSFDAALYVSELLYGAAVADELAEGLVIDWELDSLDYLVVDE